MAAYGRDTRFTCMLFVFRHNVSTIICPELSKKSSRRLITRIHRQTRIFDLCNFKKNCLRLLFGSATNEPNDSRLTRVDQYALQMIFFYRFQVDRGARSNVQKYLSSARQFFIEKLIFSRRFFFPFTPSKRDRTMICMIEIATRTVRVQQA